MSDNELEGFEDPLKESLVISIIQESKKPVRIESNAITETDLLGTLAKALVAACLDALITDHEEEENESGEAS